MAITVKVSFWWNIWFWSGSRCNWKALTFRALNLKGDLREFRDTDYISDTWVSSWKLQYNRKRFFFDFSSIFSSSDFPSAGSSPATSDSNLLDWLPLHHPCRSHREIPGRDQVGYFVFVYLYFCVFVYLFERFLTVAINRFLADSFSDVKHNVEEQ